jgi:hypothetical protein
VRAPAAGILLVAAATLACAKGPARQVDRSLAELRTREGVCAGTRFTAPDARPMDLVACLRTGSPGTVFDNGEDRLITLFQAKRGDFKDMGAWHVVVLRDGEKILSHVLEDLPSHLRCGTFTRCRERIADVAAIPGGLGPGTYTVRYRGLSEEMMYLGGEQPAELTFVLR